MKFALNRIVAGGVVAALWAFGGGVFAAGISTLTVEPAEISLRHPDSAVQLIVTVRSSEGVETDVTASAKYTVGAATASPTKSPSVAVTRGWLTPQGDGTATVSVTAQDPVSKQTLTTTAHVTVEKFAVERRVNFANDVLPVLTKSGCNSGGCHGKQGGQNGFALSLFGFETKLDYEAIVEQARGRRVFPLAPAESLLLTKATGETVHGGGVRIEKDSDSYRLLLRWINQGMPKGTTNDPVARSIEVFPRERLIDAKAQQQLRVVARFSDGSAADVTRHAEYKSQQPDILAVEHHGAVSTLDHTGEGAIMVRYQGLVDVARVSVPYNRHLPDAAFAHFKPANFVDELVLAKWKKLGIAPSENCTDEEFIRRASLDAIGTLPTPAEVRAFAADAAPDKRAKLVDRLLERNEYADYWAGYWGDLLRNKRRNGEQAKRGTFAFAAWIRDAFAQNLPYDQFVRGIVTAQGNISDSPPVVWYREVRNQVHLVNDTSQLFLGTRVACANCHNHPYERITQNDYWALAAFFARMGNKSGEVSGENAIFVKKDGEVSQPRSGKRMKPKGLLGAEFEHVRGEDSRVKLADWMAQPENPFFAKAVVNRIWARYLGVGLVESVDDMRVTNPPSNPPLLDALARDFIAHKFDLKHLQRTIMSSRTYGLSSAPTSENATDRQNYARYLPKRLPAEALLDAVDVVTGTREKHPGFPLGTRAIELPDESVSSYFLDVFGRSRRESPCECERVTAPTLAQTLHLMNSPEVQGKISGENGTVATLLKSKQTDAQIIEELYLRAYARVPNDEELKAATHRLATTKDRRALLEDFTWMLLNSKEFVFNH